MTRALSPCIEYGCPTLTRDTRCDLHQKAQRQVSDTKTGDERAFYGSARWQKLRARFRARNPLCAECDRNGRVTPMNVVDHIVAMRDGGDPWDWANLQPLCTPCHQVKRGQERNARQARRG